MSQTLSALIELGGGLAKSAMGLVSATDEAKRNAMLIEFQNAIIQFQSMIATVQAENAALVRQKGDLEKELEKSKNWEAEKSRYKMTAAYRRVTAYAIKKSMSNGEPPHYICANCYHDGKRSVLQQARDKQGLIIIVCSACGAKADTGQPIVGAPKYAEESEEPG